jgi:hypothetical protein
MSSGRRFRCTPLRPGAGHGSVGDGAELLKRLADLGVTQRLPIVWTEKTVRAGLVHPTQLRARQ